MGLFYLRLRGERVYLNERMGLLELSWGEPLGYFIRGMDNELRV